MNLLLTRGRVLLSVGYEPAVMETWEWKFQEWEYKQVIY